MPILKKLAFAPFFLIIFTVLIYQLNPILKSYDFIFSLSVNALVELIILAAFITISCFLFVLFAALAQDWKIMLPIVLLSAAIPLLFLGPGLAIVFAVAIFISFLLTSLSLDSSLKSYLNFQPSALLGPGIRQLSGLLILSICLIYFLSSSKLISQNGFQIPDSLIDTALKMTPMVTSTQQDSIAQAPADLTNDLIKQTVKDQIQGFIKPYQSFIPALLAVLLFLTFQSLVSILNLLIYPLLWITFLILEKTGFVRFEVEQRPVRKLVI